MVNGMHLVSKAYHTRTLNRKEVYSSVQRKTQNHSLYGSFRCWFYPYGSWNIG
nr:MAG TPA: hypothetical protein [Bacteriophage sp.]